MAAAAPGIDRPEFTPPPTRGLLRALGLAILAHGLLVAALTWGVRWKREADVVAVQAELWASVPTQAAPAPVAPPPAPPAPEPPKPVAETPPPPRVDIATERDKEKQRRQKAEQAKLEQQRQAEQRRAQEAREREKAQLERQRVQAQRDKQEAAQIEAQRKANLARIAGLAGANGAPTATGTAPQSAGPSASYAGRVVARVKPNIVFADSPPGNPTTVVEVRTAPDGTIVGRRLIKPSGHRAWDEAVMKALEKTDTLPRDTDGRVPPVLEISFRPKD